MKLNLRYMTIMKRLISIERKSYVKYLGVLIDSNLCWEYHISHIASKIGSRISV